MTIFKKVRTRSWYFSILLAVATFLIAVFVSHTQPFRNLELKVNDQLFELRGPIPVTESPIVLVSIGEQSDSEIPQKFPWPTELYARLINNLNEAGVKAIGLDLIFTKSDNYDPRNDTLFAEAMRKHGNVILGGRLSSESKTVQGNDPLVASTGKSSRLSKVFPIPILQQANPNPVGLVSMITDIDGFIRRYPLAQKFLGEVYNAFGVELIRLYHDLEQSDITYGNETVSIGHITIPKSDGQSMLINYYGGPGTYPSYPFEQVIDDSTYFTVMEDPDFQINGFDDPEFGLLHQGVFKDKIVLVGATMPELHDFHSTPFAQEIDRAGNAQMPGYEIHANAIQTMLDQNFYYTLNPSFTLLLIALFSILAVLGTVTTRALPGFILIALEIIGFTVLTVYLFVDSQIILEFTGSILACVIGYTGTVTYDYLSEQKEKGRIKNMFSSYVSPDLVEQMIESGQDPQLGGDETYISAFFSDIQSFSTFSEKLEAKQLVELINEYLSAMTDILTDHDGTLDKYIGDAIVAFFGAPVPVEDHAYKACIASQLVQYKQAELRAKWKSEGDKWPDIVSQMQTRIGVNTGEMVTGNMGSTQRFNYTMMGDNVNLAARCESGAKAYGVYTMITEETKKEAEKFGDRCIFRYLDRIVVKGRTKPVSMYEIVGLRDRVSATDLKCIDIYEEAMKQYMDQNFSKAIELFQESAEYEPNKPGSMPGVNTNPSLIFIERCQSLIKEPPGEDWNGVYVMKTK